MSKQLRGNAYYLNRMEVEHPAIFAEHKAGKLTAAQAIVCAGYRKKETPQLIIERAWARASADERDAIRKLICDSGTTSTATSSATPIPAGKMPTVAVFDAHEQLTADGIRAIEGRMRADGLSQSDVMDLLGFSGLNPSLWTAIRRRSAIRDRRLREAISAWINRGT